MKKTRETEQYSSTNVRMLREPSPKKFYRKECPLKLVKNIASSTSVPNYNK